MPTEPIYDVAMSFAGAQRSYVKVVAQHVRGSDARVFLDEDYEVELWGENLIERFQEIYGQQSRFVLMFISQAYADGEWTRHERRTALERALKERTAYVLPARFDDTELPGLSTAVAYIDLNGISPEELAQKVITKIELAKRTAMHPREDLWEYELLAERLQAGHQSLQQQLMDFRRGYVLPSDEVLAEPTEINQFIVARLRQGLMLGENLDRLLSPESLERALGAPGEAGDEDEICHLAGRITDLMSEVLAWCSRVRAVVVAEEGRPLLWALSRYMEGPLAGYEQFVSEAVGSLRTLVSQVRAGLPPDPPSLRLVLKFEIPDAISNEFSRLQTDYFEHD